MAVFFIRKSALISSSHRPYPWILVENRFFKRWLGFNLLELLTVVTLIGLLLLYLVPRINSMHDRALIKQKTAEIENILRLARFSATSYQQKIAICGSKNGVECVSSTEDAWSFAIVYPDHLTSESMLYIRDLSSPKLNIVVNNTHIVFDRFGFVRDETFFIARLNNRQIHSTNCLMSIKLSGQIHSNLHHASC